MALMIVVWKTPQDIDSFRRHYFEKQVLLAKKLPGLRKYEVSEEPITSPVGPSDAYIVARLHFDSMTAIRDAFASEAERVCAADRQELAPDTSSFQTFLFDTKEC